MCVEREHQKMCFICFVMPTAVFDKGRRITKSILIQLNEQVIMLVSGKTGWSKHLLSGLEVLGSWVS
jgi:hypothetical protein